MQAQKVSFLLSLVFAGGTGFTVFGASAQPAAPALKYQSAFDGYSRFADEKRANWRDVNDTAGLLGGHAAHLREVEKVVTAAGTVMEIDRAANRVRMDGDAVKPLGWPAGIAFWSLKSAALADQIKPGQRVAFRLEKDGDVYRIAAFEGDAPAAPASQKPASAPANPPIHPHAGHMRPSSSGDKK
jgi:Cu/Ag efflux protein CusF